MGRAANLFLAGTALFRLLASARADDGELGRQFQNAAAILEARCLACHGEQEPKGGLSLATAARALTGGDSGPAFVAGQPDESLLITYVSGEKPEMPQGGTPLSADEVGVLRHWIAAGAGWPADVTLKDKSKSGPWWSLNPLERPTVPTFDSAWIRTPIDAFVLARLNEQGLVHAAEADRRTLLRRLTFDLHGLPPTPEEVAAFLADERPDAYERVVDRLLTSPRYGERWGRYWLDVVHFGETHGYDKDKVRANAWRYRDYVIRALNEDKPYSRFVLEQLAGDVLWPDDPQAVIATGFIAAGPWDFVGHTELREGTVDKLIARSNDRDDMVTTAISTFASMTVHCARCHDHKFDPVTQSDYYRLQAVFAGVDRADRPYPDPEIARTREMLARERDVALAEQAQLAERRAELTSSELARVDRRQAEIAEKLAALANPFSQEGAPTSPTNGYHSDIAAKAETTKWVQVDLGRPLPIDLIRLVPARPVDFPDTPGFGFPRRFTVEVANDAAFADAIVVADHSQDDFRGGSDRPFTVRPSGTVARYVRVTAHKLWPRSNDFVFALAELQVESNGTNVAVGATVAALDSIEAGRWSTKNLVDGYSSRRQLPDVATAVGAAALDERDHIERQLLFLRLLRAQIVRELVPPELRQQSARVESRLKELDEQLKSLPKEKLVYALKSIEPRPIQLLKRGDVKSPGADIAPGALACVTALAHEFPLSESQAEGNRRVALAQWIADPANVLTWRSIVNRVWQYHFGVGLVETPNDFGRMGALPSHPELLDWLAVEFRDRGQSLKVLHKLIVTSSVYRQSSADEAANAKIDGSNRYLWRQNRRRLDAEAIRDATLAASGQLDLAMGGPSVRQFYFKDDHSPIYDYARFDVDDPGARRRSVYRFIVRSVPDPLMECLDCADPSLLTPRRNTTLTALQSLALMNNALFVRQAEHFAERVRQMSADPAGQITAAYQWALARPPRDEELHVLLDYVSQHGLANACRLILNANEFVFID